jgi:hypothetical protein
MLRSNFADDVPSNFSRSSLDLAIFRGSFRRVVGTSLMYIVLCEAAILGSGQMLHLGSVTLKMMLFVLSMFYVAVALLVGDRLSTPTVCLTLSYLAVLLLGSILGLFRGSQPRAIETELSPLLAVLFLPFFELTIRRPQQVQIVARILTFAPIVICVGYLLAVAMLWSGRLSFGEVARWLSTLGNSSAGNGDFFFDETTGRIFYKGALYLVISLFFFFFQKGLAGPVAALLIGPSLFVVGTRGFFLALFLTGLLYLVIGPIRIIKKAALILPVILLGSLLLPRVFLLAGNKNESDNIRIAVVQQALDRTNLLTVLVGNGLGVGVPMRPVHMEISYLEIFYKQGVLGLCWWAAAFFLLLIQFRRALRNGDNRLAYPFFLSCIFIAIESFTNPYLNNPIGLTFMTAAVVCLGVLGHRNVGPKSYD